MKKLILSTLLLLTIFTFPAKTEAQGTYSCIRANATTCITNPNHDCEQNHIPSDLCQSGLGVRCDDQVYPCVAATPTPTPTPMDIFDQCRQIGLNGGFALGSDCSQCAAVMVGPDLENICAGAATCNAGICCMSDGGSCNSNSDCCNSMACINGVCTSANPTNLTPPPATPTRWPTPLPNNCSDFNGIESGCNSQPNCTYIDGQCRGVNLPLNSECTQAGSTSECETGFCQYRQGALRCVTEDGNLGTTTQDGTKPYNPCVGLANADECENCHDNKGAWTAIGCIPTQPTQLASTFIRILFGIAGGIAFLLMVYGAFLCITSQGNPQKTQACKETITAAVVGLILLIFSLFIVGVLFGPTGIFPSNIMENIMFN